MTEWYVSPVRLKRIDPNYREVKVLFRADANVT